MRLNYWINQRAAANAEIDSIERELAEYVARKRNPGLNDSERVALADMTGIDAQYRRKRIDFLHLAVKKTKSASEQRSRFPVAQYRLLRAGRAVRVRVARHKQRKK